MRSRYRILERDFGHFITGTAVAWLPLFTTAARCDILVRAFEYCRQHKALKLHAWVILDTHFHAIVAAPDLADLKRHTARRIIVLLPRAPMHLAPPRTSPPPRATQDRKRASGLAEGIASAGDHERHHDASEAGIPAE